MTNAEVLAAARKLEAAAWRDYDEAQAAYAADKSEENRAAYEAATWAQHAAVLRLMELDASG